jgi:DNA-3-methyladenine glycosylase II
VLARLIDAKPDFHPNAWKDELPAFDGFGWLVFQVIGQQLSVRVTRTILSRIERQFGGRVPSAADVLAADPGVLRASGMSARKVATIRAVAERFVDGRLSDAALAGMTDLEVEAVLTDIPGIGPWTARAFLMVGLDRPDVLLSGDLALRRALQRTYALDHPPTDQEMVQIADRWRPFRSLAVSYLFASEFDSGTAPPGPRSPRGRINQQKEKSER